MSYILFHWSRTFAKKKVVAVRQRRAYSMMTPAQEPRPAVWSNGPCSSTWIFCPLYSHRLSDVSRRKDSTFITLVVLQRRIVLITLSLCLSFPTVQSCNVSPTCIAVSFLNRQVINQYSFIATWQTHEDCVMVPSKLTHVTKQTKQTTTTTNSKIATTVKY